MTIIKDKLKVKILDNNNEVSSNLVFLVNIKYEYLFSKILSILINSFDESLKAEDDIALVRFDAYADFLVPKHIQADEIQTFDHLVKYEKKNIFFNNSCQIFCF